MREFKYHWCDVFTTKPLAGNQLAVFTDAAGLTGDEMQAIAREMNLSETTFVLRRDAAMERERGVRVRIFTTQEELPFAGHPTLGTATMIRQNAPEYADAERLVLDLNAGQIRVTFDVGRSGDGATFAEMRQLDPVFGVTHRGEALAPVLGLRLEDFAEAVPETVSTGVPFCVVALQSLEALGRLRLDAATSERYVKDSDAKFFYVLAQDGDGWRARMQFYNGEDPATGAAAGCAILYLVKHGLCEPGRRVHLRQGIEMGRPSDLYVTANGRNGEVGEVGVGGSTVPVANGRLFLA
ncbi:MAG TPA: PhzF family phenazine biosynthesis protein [Acidobacteriaceae bacterium]|nr:PhzF family phenazine biosynthesis protein [Acidobacteriaceae bacterium]